MTCRTAVRAAAVALLLAVLAPAAHAQLSQTTVVAPDGAEDDFFGDSIALDGNTLVVGVRLADHSNRENPGAAYVFERHEGAWQFKQKLLSGVVRERSFFGESVALDGDRLLIGEMGNDVQEPEGGAVHAFERIDGTWTFVQTIYPSDPQDFHGFGWEIALQGDRALIGAPQDDDIDIQTGAVYEFRYEGGQWVEKHKFYSNALIEEDISFFGTTIGFDGNRAIVGSPTDHTSADLAGAAYVFEYVNGAWQDAETLLPPPVAAPDSLENDTFAREVALDGDWAFVGSGFDDEVCIEKGDLLLPDEPNICGSGAVFAYQRTGALRWELRQKIAPDELEQFDTFGLLAVQIEGDRAYVGARGDDDACPDPPPPVPLFCDTGAVYEFTLIDGTWEKTNKLFAADADSLDFLGGVFIGQGRPLGVDGPFVAGGAPSIGFGDDVSTKGKAIVWKMYNRDPVAEDDEATTGDTAVTIDVRANDHDPDYDALAVAVATQPSGGTAEASGDGTITYTPNGGFAGTDTFTYTLTDEDGGTATASVSVTVSGSAPVVTTPIADLDLLAGGDPFVVDLTTVFSDPNGDPLSFTAASEDASIATATVAANVLTVTPLAVGSTTVEVTADDGTSGTASTSFNVSIPSGVSVEPGAEVPAAYQLGQNYPNPFNPQTTIRYGLPEAATVTLTLIDVTGRTVAVLAEGTRPAGWHDVSFDATGLPSGVYLYRLDTPGASFTRAMLLLR